MKAYKYEERTSAGSYGWEYIIVPDWVGTKDGCSIEDYLDDLNILCTWSEHYGGVECKKIKKLPKDILDKEITNFKFEIRDNRETLAQLKEMKEKFYPQEEKRRK